MAALGALVITLSNQPKSSLGDSVIEATQIAPTIWPLAFAAIVGGMLRLAAHKYAERGTKLGVGYNLPILPLKTRPPKFKLLIVLSGSSN